MIFPGLCLWEMSLWPPLSKAVFPTGHRQREWGSGTLNQPNRKATTGSPPGLLATARGGWQESGVGRVRGRPTGWAAPH